MVLLIFPQHSQAGADIHSDDVERILRTLEKGFIRTTLGVRSERIDHLGQVSEAGDELRVVVNHGVLDVKIENLQTAFISTVSGVRGVLSPATQSRETSG